MVLKIRETNDSGENGNRTRRKAALLAAPLVTTAMIASACSSSPAKGAGSSDTGAGGSMAQSIRFGISNQIPKLITGVDQGAAVDTVLSLIHRGLMAYDANGKLIPGLASSVKTPRPDTYVFTLRPHLQFSDGTAVTGSVVKADLEYYSSEKNQLDVYTGLKDIKSVKASGNTVTVQLTGPNTAFLQWLAVPNAAIVPKSSLNAKTPNTVGAGPFKWEQYNSGVDLKLVKNKQYYGASHVKLEKIDVIFYPDANSRVNALLGGDVDLIDYVPWPQWDQVAKAAGITVAGQQGPFQYVQFNVTKKPFSNPKVREAVAYALNRTNSVAAAFQGHGQPLYGIDIPKSDAAYDPANAKLWSYDAAKAKQLLSEAGYPNGFKASLLSTSQYAFLQDLALSVQADLKAIGIDAKMDAPDWATRINKGNDGDYDLAVSGGAGRVADPSYLQQYVTGPNGYNRSYGYDNKDLDAALNSGLQATSPSAKKAAYARVAEIVKSDVPFATLNTREQAFAYNAHVKGFKNLPGFLTFYGGYSFPDVSMVK